MPSEITLQALQALQGYFSKVRKVSIDCQLLAPGEGLTQEGSDLLMAELRKAVDSVFSEAMPRDVFIRCVDELTEPD